MPDFNRVILMGRIGNDLELKTSSQGKEYLRISLATNTYVPGSEKSTHWHRVVVFGTQATICNTYLRKGSSVLVEGMLQTSAYKNSKGVHVKEVSVIAQRIQFLGGRISVNTEKGVEEEASDHLEQGDYESPSALSA